MILRSLIYVSAVVSSCLLLSACRSSRAATATDSQGRVANMGRQQLDVLIDEGNSAEMNEKQFRFRKELRTYMERDLPRKLARQGIDMRLITSPSQNTGGPDEASLLIIRYEAYNPGSSAARMWVGYGAGAASLDTSMTYCKGGKEIQSWKDGCGTSQHWSRVINTLDDHIAKKIKELMSK